jgi:LacI family transcriptional regulator
MAAVADAAGVSVPTVSKVLNRRGDVAPETRLRIEALLAESGYSRPKRRHRPAGVMDLVFTEFSAWAMEIIRGAQEAALTEGIRLAVSATPSEQDEERWLRSLVRGKTDGVILVLTSLSREHRETLASLDVPIVIVDPDGQPDPTTPSIGAANWAGGLTATEHLVSLGHQRIGTITGRPSVLCSQARLAGYRAALEHAGLPYDTEIVAYGDFHYESALKAASDMLELPNPPTAIFAASDVQAMGVYEAARQHRINIPENLSVVGFDDVPMAQWASPPLTTLHQPLAEMASLALRTLLHGDGGLFNNRVELSTSLVVRESTASPSRRHA